MEQRKGARERILLGKQIEECIYDSIPIYGMEFEIEGCKSARLKGKKVKFSAYLWAKHSKFCFFPHKKWLLEHVIS